MAKCKCKMAMCSFFCNLLETGAEEKIHSSHTGSPFGIYDPEMMSNIIQAYSLSMLLVLETHLSVNDTVTHCSRTVAVWC